MSQSVSERERRKTEGQTRASGARRSCDGVRPGWKEAPVLPAGLACFIAIILAWPTAHTRRLPSFSGPPTVTGVFSWAKVGHSFPAFLPCPGPILHFSSDCSVLQAIFVLDKKTHICGRVTLRVTLRILQQRCMSTRCRNEQICIAPASE